MKLFRRWLRRDDHVSDRWLKAHARREERVDWHSAPIRFPIRKVLDDSPLWNAAKLKRVS